MCNRTFLLRLCVMSPARKATAVKSNFFVALLVFSLCPFDISAVVGAFVIGLSQITSFFSLCFVCRLGVFVIRLRQFFPFSLLPPTFVRSFLWHLRLGWLLVPGLFMEANSFLNVWSFDWIAVAESVNEFCYSRPPSTEMNFLSHLHVIYSIVLRYFGLLCGIAFDDYFLETSTMDTHKEKFE